MKVTLVFDRAQLLYDIGNCAFIEGEAVAQVDAHQRHTVQDAVEGGNRDRVLRVVELAIAKCRDMLYPYAKSEISGDYLENDPDNADAYVIELDVPAGVASSSLELLEKSVHEYATARAVADWMSITNPQKAELWLMKTSEAEREVKLSMNTRMRRVRRGVAPF